MNLAAQSGMRASAFTTTLLFCVAPACFAAPTVYSFERWACTPDSGPTQAEEVVGIGCEQFGLLCQAGSQVAVRVHLEGPERSRATLTVGNATEAFLEQLTVAGNARRLNSSTIIVQPGVGDSTIRGFRGSSAAASVPSPVITSSISVPIVPAGGPLPAETAGRVVSLQITQLVGSAVIRDVRLDYAYHPCTVAAAAGDQVQLGGFTSATNAVVLLDGRRESGCASMEIHQGPANMFLGNVLANSSPDGTVQCESRAAIFTDSKAAEYRPDLQLWTQNPTDELGVALKNPVVESVKFWLLYDPCVVAPTTGCLNGGAAAVKLWPSDELAGAQNIYKQQLGGIAFNNVAVIDLSQAQGELQQVVHDAWNTPGCNTPENTATTLARLHRVLASNQADRDDGPKHLNVFYILTTGIGDGLWCGVHDPGGIGADTILIRSST